MSGVPFTVILNPASGNRRGQRFVPAVQEVVEARGGRLRFTESAGHATELAREERDRGVPIIFAAGGDDTVREVIHGIFGGGSLLGIVPLGTFNNVAASLQLPHSPIQALEGALDGMDDCIDLGQVDDGPIFTESVGVGIDAEAWSLAPDQEPTGKGSRFLQGLRLGFTSLRTFKPQHIHISIDGWRVDKHVMQVTVANSKFFGATIQMAPHARLDDGLLDVCIIPEMDKLRFFFAMRHIVSGRHLDEIPDVQYFQGREVTIHTSARRPTPVRVDGVIAGQLPVTLRILPRALRIRLPRRPEPEATTPPVAPPFPRPPA